MTGESSRLCRCIYSEHCHGGVLCKLSAGGTVNEGGGVCAPRPQEEHMVVPPAVKTSVDLYEAIVRDERRQRDRAIASEAEAASWHGAFVGLAAREQQLLAVLTEIAQNTALSAETHRLMAQDVLGGFVDRGAG